MTAIFVCLAVCGAIICAMVAGCVYPDHRKGVRGKPANTNTAMGMGVMAKWLGKPTLDATTAKDDHTIH